MAARSDARVLLIGESGPERNCSRRIFTSTAFSVRTIREGELRRDSHGADRKRAVRARERRIYGRRYRARRGKFELADGGTIFLDEVGDLHAGSQAKLLRVLQEGEFHRVGGEQPVHVNVRVISATNRELSEMIADGKFREDLYYRLCVVPVRVPSLRERPQDVPAMAEYFLSEFCDRNNFRDPLVRPCRVACSASLSMAGQCS